MECYTYQISQWRSLQGFDGVLIDTTVKTGDPRLAPTWDMVWGIKKGTWSERAYTDLYHARLDHYWFSDPLFFDTLCRHPRVAFGCYCPPGQFCHRHLLVSFLCHHVNATYHGELTKTQPGPLRPDPRILPPCNDP